MPFVFYNNAFIDTQIFSFGSGNRSFRYGDGLFETIFVSNGNPLFIALHTDRLLNGMQALQIEIPLEWNVAFFDKTISALTQKNAFTNTRVRMTVWRDGEGLFQPQKNSACLLIEQNSIDYEDYFLNIKGLMLGTFDRIPKAMGPLAAFKTANALTYVLAAKYAAEQKFDDVVVLNNEGFAADAISSNIFLLKDKKIMTPSLSEGCIDGVMRKVILTLCREESMEVYEGRISPDDLLFADEIFLTNALQGIKWVGKYNEVYYGNKFSADLIYGINERKNNFTLVSPRPPAGG